MLPQAQVVVKGRALLVQTVAMSASLERMKNKIGKACLLDWPYVNG